MTYHSLKITRLLLSAQRLHQSLLERSGSNPLYAVVGRTVRHRLPCPVSRKLNDIVASFLAVDDGLGFSGNVKTVLSIDVYLEVVCPF